jgi:hypothetical protein
VYDLGFMVYGLWFMVWGCHLPQPRAACQKKTKRPQALSHLELRGQGAGFRVAVKGLGFRVQGSGFRVQGSEFRVY